MPSTKASTMPGFMERKNMGRHRSFTDGIRIVQQANQYDPKTLQELSNKIHDSEETAARRKMSSDAMYVASASVPDSLIAFTQEIHQEQRITPKEEVELATKTQEAIRLQFLFDHLEEKLCREPTDAEWCAAAGKINMEALRQTMQEGIDAKNELVTSNLRMVQGVVNVYLRNGLGSQYNAGDLMQEGILVRE
jgi:DNA-directed RNA polymerase sigma subunit (sigma70/sigma32)